VTAFAQLSGVPVTRLHLVVPALGLWHVDADLSTSTDVSGPQTLVLSGSTWTCAVVRAVDFAGVRSLRLVGGAGGWRKTVPALQYASPAGVPTATVLGDASSLGGERPPVIDPSVPATLGVNYVRQAGPASLVLQDLQDRGVLTWWQDMAGVVQTKPRPSTAVQQPFVAEEVRGSAGWYRIATETPGEWLPGATFSSVTVSGTISRVEHRIDGGKFWTEILVP
jgi:hypothetical protein